MSKTLIERLKRLDSSAMSDALDRLTLKGVSTSLRALSVRRRIAGVAITVQLGPAGAAAPTTHLCTRAVDAGGPGTIIVIAHNGCTDVAGWGGILSAGAVVRGIEGVVIDGACRDIDESEELGLPVYGRAVVPTTARGRIVEMDWNVPVTIDGIAISPGDFLIADGSGLVAVEQSHAEEVIAVAESIAARERAMSEHVRSGKPMVEVMGTTYEKMLVREPTQ